MAGPLFFLQRQLTLPPTGKSQVYCLRTVPRPGRHLYTDIVLSPPPHPAFTYVQVWRDLDGHIAGLDLRHPGLIGHVLQLVPQKRGFGAIVLLIRGGQVVARLLKGLCSGLEGFSGVILRARVCMGR